MKRLLIVFALALAFGLPYALAEDLEIKTDPNGIPGSAGVNSSGETRNLTTDDDGHLQVDILTTAAADGSVTITDPAGVNQAEVSAAGELEVSGDGGADLASEATAASILVDTTTIATDTTSIDADTTTIAGDTTSIDGKTPALGQALSASSIPVVIASDQSASDVQGPDADGAPSTANPVQVGGVDISGNAQSIAVNPNGVIVLGDPVSSAVDTVSNVNILTRIEDVNGTAGYLGVAPIYFNNATWDRTRGNAFGAFTQGPIVEGGVATGFPFRMGGWDGTDIYTLKVDTDGHLQIDVLTNGLPTGAATEATLATIDADTSALFGTVAGSEQQVDVVTSALPAGAATEATLATIDADTSALFGTVAGSEQQVDVVTSALPSGASTEAKQDNNITQVTAIELNTDTGTLIDHATVVVGNSATLIAAADTSRRSITIINGFTNLVAIGNSDVTLNSSAGTDGFVLASGSPAGTGKGGSITLNTTAAVYGIGASASSEVNYIVELD